MEQIINQDRTDNQNFIRKHFGLIVEDIQENIIKLKIIGKKEQKNSK